MGAVHGVSTLVMHAQVHYEAGAIEELHKNRDEEDSNLILMTHFRRWDPIIMAQITRTQEPLQHFQYNTGITARRSLFDAPVIKYIVRNSGAQPIDRALENLAETPGQRIARQEANQKTQSSGSKFLANGYHWLIYPEGGSKKLVESDGQTVKQARKPGELLPIRNGFVYTLEAMSAEDRERVRLLGIVVHYGERRFASLRPTVHISQPVRPVPGSREAVRLQGEAILQSGLDEAMRLDGLR